jgi:hypothetical protein
MSIDMYELEDPGPAPVAPGVGFPCYPPDQVAAHENSTEEQMTSLGTELLMDGTESRGGGKFWCGYCEEDLPSVAAHLETLTVNFVVPWLMRPFGLQAGFVLTSCVNFVSNLHLCPSAAMPTGQWGVSCRR